jgi:ferredoxin
VPFFTARLEGSGLTCEAWPEQSLLDALEQGGLRWSSSCRSGTCRTCMGQLVSGQVRYNMAWPGLLPEEKEAGCVLPCVAFATSDVVLKELP